MANKFQVKRTAVSGRTPNTTSSGNTHFIDTGELALNLTDGKMFSSNGTVYFEVGANLINASITNILSVAAVSANGSNGTSGQVLTSNGTSTYWSTVSGGGGGNTSFSRSITSYTANGTANSFAVTGGYIVGQLDVFVNGVRYNSSDFTATDSTNVNLVDTPNSGDTVELVSYVGTGGNFTNGQSISVVDLVVTGGLTANGGVGTSGQVLTSNGTTPYWSTVGGGFTNGQSISVADLVVTGGLTANGGIGSDGQTLYSNGTSIYWANTSSASGPILTASATAPASPEDGSFWYKTTTDVLYQYIDDGTSSYWVDVITPVVSSSGGSGSNNIYTFTGTTTGNTETEIFIGGVANTRLSIAANTTVTYDITISARRTDATGFSAGYNLKGVIDNFSGTVADVGNLYETIIARDNAGYLVDARADDTNDSLGIYVTGVSGHTINWKAIVTTVEVGE